MIFKNRTLDQPPRPNIVFDNFNWIYVSVAFLFLVFLIVIVGIFYRKRKGYKKEYQPLRTNRRSYQKRFEMNERGSIESLRDTALLDCLFYIRSFTGVTLSDHLPQLGFRPEKNWFLLNDCRYPNRIKAQILLTLCKTTYSLSVQIGSSPWDVLRRIVSSVKHPYINPVLNLDFIQHKNLVVVQQYFSQNGSLRDLIYKSHCCQSYLIKYGGRGRALPLKMVKLYSRQVLEALLYLDNVGIHYYGLNLHSGNVVIENQKARISGLEEHLLQFDTNIIRLLNVPQLKETKAVTVLSFGQLLWEMCLGKEPKTSAPKEEEFDLIKDESSKDFLKWLFLPPDGVYPKLAQIKAHPYYWGIQVDDTISSYTRSLEFSKQTKKYIRSLNKTIHKRLLRRSKKSIMQRFERSMDASDSRTLQDLCRSASTERSDPLRSTPSFQSSGNSND